MKFIGRMRNAASSWHSHIKERHIHKIFSPCFRKVKNGTSVIKNITDGFHHILPSRFQLEEKRQCLTAIVKGIIIYKETDGDGHVYLRPFLQFLLFSFQFGQPGNIE